MTSQGWSNPRQALVVSFINCKDMLEHGWVRIHRKILKWEWYQKSEMVHLFLHFLLLANHEDDKWQGQIIKRGQFVTGLDQLKKDTGISRQTIRTCINRLKSTGELTSKSTNKYRLISLINYDEYQTKEEKLTPKLTPKLTVQQHPTNILLTANKNNKNIRIKELNTKADKSAYCLDDKIKSMLSSTDKRMPVIAKYWFYKQLKPETEERYRIALKRELRASSDLTAWPIDQIDKTMFWLNGTKITDWTMETVIKYIDKDLEELSKNNFYN
jgi:biotin operon repressor